MNFHVFLIMNFRIFRLETDGSIIDTGNMESGRKGYTFVDATAEDSYRCKAFSHSLSPFKFRMSS